jgi:hypothetical protein
MLVKFLFSTPKKKLRIKIKKEEEEKKFPPWLWRATEVLRSLHSHGANLHDFGVHSNLHWPLRSNLIALHGHREIIWFIFLAFFFL